MPTPRPFPLAVLERVPLLGRVEARTLVGVLLVVGAIWGFGALAAEVMEGDTEAFDRAILLALRSADDLGTPVGPPALETAMRDLTALGGVVVLTLVSVAVAGALWIRGQPRSALFLAVAVGGGQAISHLGKLAFNRARPDLVPHFTDVTSSSFPSGHSMMAAVTWLTLAVMLARAERSRAMRAWIVGIAVLVTLLVGVSRVYLGVHWPSDVAAGWMVGAAWALLCAIVARALDRRGSIEHEKAPTEA